MLTLVLDPDQMSFFVGQFNVKSTARPGMARWPERLYAGLARIVTRPTEFFRIPADRVIEIGAEVEIGRHRIQPSDNVRSGM